MSREAGFAFEREFVAMAQSHGYSARRALGHRPHDAIVGSKRVQCKYKSFDDNGRVRIAKGQHKYRQGDWDVLALCWRGDLYLIPEVVLRVPGGTLLTVIKPKRFRKWLNAWNVFDGVSVPVGQQSLFDT